jgi:hypothetical protein
MSKTIPKIDAFSRISLVRERLFGYRCHWLVASALIWQGCFCELTIMLGLDGDLRLNDGGFTDKSWGFADFLKRKTQSKWSEFLGNWRKLNINKKDSNQRFSA